MRRKQHPSSLLRGLDYRARGRLSGRAFMGQRLQEGLSHLALSRDLEVESGQRGPINHLDLDPLDHRYVLAAAGDATVALYDLEDAQPTLDPEAPPRVKHMLRSQRSAQIRDQPPPPHPYGNPSSSSSSSRPLPSSAPCPHRFGVSWVEWYPVDTGMFVSGAMDETVKVWDTNRFEVAGEFHLGSKVYVATMPRGGRGTASGHHTLVATGTDSYPVYLCDLTSGSHAHQLSGHSGGVLTAAWCPTNDNLLATGSRDSTIRLWDIRRSGPTACLLSFDQHRDHGGAAPTTTTRPRGGTSSSLSHGPASRATNPNANLNPLHHRPTELAKAHAGHVVSVAFTPDGRYLLSAGLDKRVRLWHAATGDNTLCNYANTRNDKVYGWSMTVVQPGNPESCLLFYPNGPSGEVLVYRVHGTDGGPVQCLSGHLDTVNSVVYRPGFGGGGGPQQQQIITGGSDSCILVFDRSSKDRQERERLDREEEEVSPGNNNRQSSLKRPREDWSDDDEEGGGGGGYVPPILRQGY